MESLDESVEKVRKNNIELAKTLNVKKKEIQSLQIELQEIRWRLLDSNSRLKGMNSKNVVLEIDIAMINSENARLKAKLDERDQTLAEWRQLLTGLIQSNTSKYCEVMISAGIWAPRRATAVPLVPKTEPVDLKIPKIENTIETESQPIPSQTTLELDSGEMDALETTAKNDNIDDSIEMVASSPSGLYPKIMVVKNEDESEFSDDSIAEPSPAASKFPVTDNSIETETEVAAIEKTEIESIMSNQPSTKCGSIPTITISSCADINVRKSRESKRKSSFDFLQVPGQYYGARKSDTALPFQNKSPRLSLKGDKLSTPSVPVRARSMNLTQIVEVSPSKIPVASTTLWSCYLNQSKDSQHKGQSPLSSRRIKPLSFPIFKQSTDQSPNKLTSPKTPLMDSTKKMAPKVDANSVNGSLKRSTDDSTKDKQNHSPGRSPQHLVNKTVQSNSLERKDGFSPTDSIKSTGSGSSSPIYQRSKNVSSKQPLKNLTNNKQNQTQQTKKNSSKNAKVKPDKPSNDLTKDKENSPSDCIANHRPTRRAAPKDLREPLLKMKMRRDF